MIAIAALLLIQSTTSVGIGVDTKKGAAIVFKSRPTGDSTRRDTTRRAPRAIVTPALLASAYKDAAARSMIGRAREARMTQDSSIQSYDATTLQRMTAGMGLSRFGRDRMLFRYESSSRVRWLRGVGASIEITGRRAVAPSIGKADIEIDEILSPVPYFPGRDALWAGFVQVKDEISDEGLIHPLATAAEAYYVYETGDSLRFHLADGVTIRLREVLVRPRKLEWRAVVGSLWFDVESGQLVRAAFKLSEPLDFWTLNDGEAPPPYLVKAMMDPMTGSVTGMAIEYGLHDGKYWMPRTQTFEGNVQLGFMRLPLRIDESFQYSSFNASDIVVAVPEKKKGVGRDTSLAGLTGLARDSARLRLRHARDSVAVAEEEQQCAHGGIRDERVSRYGGALIVGLHVPCDDKALAESPTLPKSIFDDGDKLFNDAMRDELLARAEALMPEPTLAFHKPQARWTFGMLRFNRVEGLSSGLLVEQSLGRDMMLRAMPRIGVADRVPNGELSLVEQRSHSELVVTGYRRLIADTEWGDPLSFGSSLSALLFGRDEGMYYRGTGAELSGAWQRSIRTFWTVYGQRESDAIARNTRSLPQLLGGAGFKPAGNIVAQLATQYGSTLRFVGSHGVDPRGWRTLADLRLDGATGDFDFARGSLDLNLSHVLVGPYGASFTLSGGSSIGTVPVQHLYFLGGSSTVRGQSAGAMAGNAYWFGRAELGKGLAGRRVLFADLGWAGDRGNMRQVGRPMSGVGVGFSVLDGLFRFDVARGLYPEKQFRITLYMDSKY